MDEAKSKTYEAANNIMTYAYWSVSERIVEKDVENAIISNLQKFLLGMGRGFCFVDRQMHICTETTDVCT